jgi:hypothetical protein
VQPLPFRWVEELAGGLGGSPGRAYGTRSRAGAGPRFDLPGGYLRYSADADSARAMSAGGVQVLVRKHENYEGGTTEFWSKLARRALVERKCILIAEESDPELDSSAKAHVIHGRRQLDGAEHAYLLAVTANPREVWTFEAWGPALELGGDLEKLKISLRSMRVRR